MTVRAIQQAQPRYQLSQPPRLIQRMARASSPHLHPGDSCREIGSEGFFLQATSLRSSREDPGHE